MSGEWRDVPGYGGVYQVTNDGQVRSVRRRVLSRRGYYKPMPGVILRQRRASGGRLCVHLYREAKSKTVGVHRIVAETFLADSYFDGAEVCHNDGDADNNHVSNLRWDTHSANVLDTVRHGNHAHAKKTHCKRNHLFSEENGFIERKNTGTCTRRCRICIRENQRARRAAARELRQRAA
jgi:hypothetical protein